MNRSQGLTVVLLAGVLACGGTEPEDVFELTKEQAVAMFTAMKGFEIALDANGSFVVQCPDGGEAELVGGVEVTRYPVAIGVDRDYTATPRDCVVDTGDGNRFTLAGETGFRNMLRITINLVPGRPNVLFVEGAIWGNVTWTTGDHTEECMVDLRLTDHSTDPEAPVHHEYEGGLCGFDVELEFTQEYTTTMPPRYPMGAPRSIRPSSDFGRN